MDLREKLETECARLTAAFREMEKRKFSDDCYTRDEDGKLLKIQYWEQLQKSTTEYYYRIYIDKLWKIIDEMGAKNIKE